MNIQQTKVNILLYVKYKDRIWATLKDEPKNRIFYTKKDNETFSDLQFFEVDTEIKRLTQTENFLLIWTETEIWILTGEPKNDLEVGTLRIFAYDDLLFVNIINTVQEIHDIEENNHER